MVAGADRAICEILENVPSPLGPRDEQGAREFAARTLDHAMGFADSAAVTVERLEFERIAGNCGGGNIYQYAPEAQLTHPELPDRVRITNLGRAFLRLRGRDAVRWLLTAEVLQSTGRWDPWRTPRPLLKDALMGSTRNSTVTVTSFCGPTFPRCKLPGGATS